MQPREALFHSLMVT